MNDIEPHSAGAGHYWLWTGHAESADPRCKAYLPAHIYKDLNSSNFYCGFNSREEAVVKLREILVKQEYIPC